MLTPNYALQPCVTLFLVAFTLSPPHAYTFTLSPHLGCTFTYHITYCIISGIAPCWEKGCYDMVSFAYSTADSVLLCFSYDCPIKYNTGSTYYFLFRVGFSKNLASPVYKLGRFHKFTLSLDEGKTETWKRFVLCLHVISRYQTSLQCHLASLWRYVLPMKHMSVVQVCVIR